MQRLRALSRWPACLVVVSCVTAGSWIGSAQQSSRQDRDRVEELPGGMASGSPTASIPQKHDTARSTRSIGPT